MANRNNMMIDLTVVEIVGISFACVTVVGIVGFLFLYNCCDTYLEDSDEENDSSKTVPLVSDQEDHVHMTDETDYR